jgi:hypothetical protein
MRTDNLALAAAVTPAAIVRDGFREIPEIEQVYLANAGDSGVTALIIIDKKNYAAMQRIFEKEAQIIEALPGLAINFDLIIRDGRSVGDLISPRGNLLFQR